MAAWFKPKRYGFGAAPASWQGWALTIAYVAIIAALGVWFSAEEGQVVERAPAFIGITLALTIVFVGIAWRTTEGGWRWRWGGKD
ncbi:MAG: hypothetical protein ACK4X1_13715 [Terricaulis sp.]